METSQPTPDHHSVESNGQNDYADLVSEATTMPRSEAPTPEVGAEPVDIEALIDEDLGVKAALAELQQFRGSNPRSGSEQDYVDRVKDARMIAKAEVETKLGLNGEQEQELVALQERKSEVEALRNGLTGEEREEEVMHKLGILDQEGHYVFPEGIFSSQTKTWFDDYMRLVQRWDEAVAASAADHMEVPELVYLETARGIAHDQTATQMAKESGGLLDFDEARRLIAKFRDHQIPDSGELKRHARVAKKALELAAERIYEHEARLRKDQAA